MKALRIQSLDGPKAAHLVEMSMPEPRSGQVLVRVEAAGLNYSDVAQSHGEYPGGPQPPFVAGSEMAGEVVAVGDGVEDFSPGDAVMGVGSKAFAEYAVWNAAALFKRPPDWSAPQGAAFLIAWLTAHGCLRTVGRLQKDETVLIHAAAGGVGQAACRIANHFGARVIGTSTSSEKLEAIKGAGAHHAINTRDDDFVEKTLELTGGQGADLILEMVGGDVFRKNLKAQRAFGRMVVYGAASGESANVNNVHLIFKPVEVIGYHLSVLMRKRPDLFAEEMTEVMALIKAGVMKPDEPTQIPLADGAQALADMRARKTRGKVVLIP
jgi:NADPH2:quinone reductase